MDIKRRAGRCLAVVWGLWVVLGGCAPAESGPEARALGARRDAVGAPLEEPWLVKNLVPDPVGQTLSSNPRRFLPSSGALFVLTDDAVWALNGQDARVPRYKDKPLDPSDWSQIVLLGDSLYLINPYSFTDVLVRTDGTDAGTQQVLREGLWFFGDETSLCQVGSTLYLSLAGSGTGGVGLWRHTREGVSSLVKPLQDVSRMLVREDGSFFFFARESATGKELWVSDGSTAGTRLVKDLTPGPSGSTPGNMVVVGNVLYFALRNTLWRSDGTEAGTVPLRGFASLDSSAFRVVGTQLFFLALESTPGLRLWTTDGTAAGTHLVSKAPEVARLQPMGTSLYFLTYAGGEQLWKTDGTEAGTVRVSNFGGGYQSGSKQLAVTDSRVFVYAYSCEPPSYPECGPRLWTWGATGGTPEVVPLAQSTLFDRTGARGDTLYFVGDDIPGGVEPWRSDGTAVGTWRLADLNQAPVTRGGTPTAGVAVGGAVLFNPLGASGLWRGDGSPQGTTVIPGTQNVSWSSSADNQLKVDGVAYVTATDSTRGTELWRSDGTAAGTWLVKDIQPGSASSNPYFLAALGSRFLFTAEHPSYGGRALWVSDGTAAGTTFVKDIHPTSSAWSSEDGKAVALGGAVYFAVDDGVAGQELWKSDGTAQGTVRVADVVAGAAGSSPHTLTRHLDSLFFFATAGSARALYQLEPATGALTQVSTAENFERSLTSMGSSLYAFSSYSTLWRFDGTSRLWSKVVQKDSDWRQPAFAPLVLGDQFLFEASTLETGLELWRSDGTAEGTRMVKDIRPGKGRGLVSIRPSLVLADHGRVLFQAQDGVHGKELWESDGTEAGTRMVKDINPFGSSEPDGFVRVGNGVFFSANDGVTGPEPWWLPLPALSGSAPPVLTCPAPVGVEALSASGAPASWPPATVSDDSPGTPQVTYSAVSGSTFPVGTTSVRVRAEDDTGSVSFCSFPVAVRDTVAPTVTCPADKTLASTSLVGAVVSYAPATAVDAVTAAPTLTYSHPSGVLFPLGTTQVTARATDAAGNAGQCSFRVTVTDGMAPWIRCPETRFAEATSASGAVVDFAATAGDGQSEVTVTYSQAPGSVFRLGTTAVTATARDEAGNSATCSFAVGVRDTTAPVLSCPASLVKEATGAEGASVSFLAGVSDAVTAAPSVRYSRASGGVFALDQTTEVTVTATDGAGNVSTCAFSIAVVDTTPPVLTCPADRTVEVGSPAGAWVDFSATARDVVSGATPVVATPAAGSTFPLGQTLVRVTSQDARSNQASCSFRVTVRDTQKPWITCPGDQLVEATSAAGATASFALEATDVSGRVTVTSSPASGAVFALGTTTVTATATDGAGNTNTCGFKVSVRDTTPPVLTCPQSVRLEATSASGAAGLYSVTASDAVTASLLLTYTPVPGSLLPLGTTLVTAATRDAAGNTSSCTFPVTVEDTTKPFLACAAPLFIEAASAAGTPVTYDWVHASDAVSEVTLSYSRPSGGVFPRGETEVTVLARDAAGNVQACGFVVRVVDSLAPALVCPTARVAEATGPGGAPVDYSVTASDAVTAAPRLEASHASGSVFALGTTGVTVTAWDEADNHRACTFPVTVRDTTAPALTCPAAVVAEASGPTGTPVSYAPATATDAVSAVVLGYSVASGSRFPLGTTRVGVVARDAAGNPATCAFDVTVRDTTAPTLTCPGNLTREAESAEGTAVGFVATVRDGASSRLVPAYSHAPGSVFPVGQTRVHASARDPSGNLGTCSFLVTVVNGRVSAR